MDRVRGRGRGNPRSNPSRSGGRQFMGSGVQSHRRFDPQPGVSSRGRREKFVDVPKHQEGPNSHDAMSGVSEEVHPVIASDLPHNGIENSPTFSSPRSSSSHMGEEKTRIGQTSIEIKCDNMTITSSFSIKLGISCQQVENSLSSNKGDAGEDEPLFIKGPKTPASDRKSEVSESSASFVLLDICPPKTCGVKLKPPLFVKNRESRNETKQTIEGLDRRSLRPGMVILKSYISPSDQQPGGSSRGRRGKFMYIPKPQVGPNSHDAKSGVSEEVHPVIASDLPHNGIENCPPLSSPQGSSLHTEVEKTCTGQISEEVKCNNVKLTDDSPNKLDISCQQVENSLPLKHIDEDETGFKTTASDRKSGNSESSAVSVPFDICLPKTGGVKLKPLLFVKNRESGNETKQTIEGLDGRSLRPGMVILKSYISPSDQIKIVKQCRELGLGPGGFYQPGYRNGAKLHLNMVCLGKNWDPQTRKYDDYRPTDGAKPPAIPEEFYNLVEKAIQDSHSLISKEPEAGNAEKILPRMRPDICIVNFYSTNRLHQDRDESRDSIDKGLPVVSFSIGDTATFLYGDERDADQAKDVLLES